MITSGLLLGLTGINQNNDCGECEGGVTRVAIICCEHIDIDATTFDEDAGCFTGIAFNTSGVVAEYVPDDDDSAFFNITGERTNPKIHRGNIEGFLKFACLTKEKIAEANRLKSGCCYVAVVEHSNCITMVYGLEIVKGCNGANESSVAFSKTKMRATVSVLFGTGTEEDRIEVTFNGVSRCVGMPLDTAGQTFDDIVNS